MVVVLTHIHKRLHLLAVVFEHLFRRGASWKLRPLFFDAYRHLDATRSYGVGNHRQNCMAARFPGAGWYMWDKGSELATIHLQGRCFKPLYLFLQPECGLFLMTWYLLYSRIQQTQTKSFVILNT